MHDAEGNSFTDERGDWLRNAICLKLRIRMQNDRRDSHGQSCRAAMKRPHAVSQNAFIRPAMRQVHIADDERRAGCVGQERRFIEVPLVADL